MPPKSRISQLALVTTAILAFPLAGCSTLPSSGPTGAQIIAAQKGEKNQLNFQLVELSGISALPIDKVDNSSPSLLAAMGRQQPSDIIGPGDILEIVIYEAGIALFSGTTTPLGGSTFDPTAKPERLPPVRVDDNGFITVPYVGRIRAAGHTPADLQQIIIAGLAGKSQSPQVLVSVQLSITNSVIVSGEVVKSGRVVLAGGNETLLDVIAIAGGYRGEASDLVVHLEREGRTLEDRLSNLARGTLGSMRILPGDRIELIREPQSFSAFGAPGKVELIPFGKQSISLAEAVARVGGSNPNLGDPAAIFVFRFVPDGESEKPVVYHLNMMKTGSYFLAQKFTMKDKDVLYVGNARANQPSKLVQIISQLFSPVITARDIARQ